MHAACTYRMGQIAFVKCSRLERLKFRLKKRSKTNQQPLSLRLNFVTKLVFILYVYYIFTHVTNTVLETKENLTSFKRIKFISQNKPNLTTDNPTVGQHIRYSKWATS
jgi:hypothetical protein